MMVGNNTIAFNEATMKVALQYYFDNVLFAKGAAPRVESVSQASSGNTVFTIRVTEATKTEKENQE